MVNIVTNGRHTYFQMVGIATCISKAIVTLFIDVMMKLQCPVNAYHHCRIVIHTRHRMQYC